MNGVGFAVKGHIIVRKTPSTVRRVKLSSWIINRNKDIPLQADDDFFRIGVLIAHSGAS